MMLNLNFAFVDYLYTFNAYYFPQLLSINSMTICFHLEFEKSTILLGLSKTKHNN